MKVLTSGYTFRIFETWVPHKGSVAEHINWRLAVVVRIVAITAVVVWIVKYVECNVVLHFMLLCACWSLCVDWWLISKQFAVARSLLIFSYIFYHESCSKIICRRLHKITTLKISPRDFSLFTLGENAAEDEAGLKCEHSMSFQNCCCLILKHKSFA